MFTVDGKISWVFSVELLSQFAISVVLDSCHLLQGLLDAVALKRTVSSPSASLFTDEAPHWAPKSVTGITLFTLPAGGLAGDF